MISIKMRMIKIHGHKEIFSKTINIVGQTSFKKGFLDISMPGEYMIVAQGKDISGKQVETKLLFTVFSTTGRTMPGNMINTHLPCAGHRDMYATYCAAAFGFLE